MPEMQKGTDGIHVPLVDSKYSPLTISLNNQSHYWNPDFQLPLLTEAPDSFPVASPDNSVTPRQVDFHSVDMFGSEMLSKSSSSAEVRIPRRELKKLQQKLESIHQLAEDQSIPADRREFFKKFTLPHPMMMPEAWRVCGRFKKRLMLLWGIKGRNNDASVFLPQTRFSEKWDDSGSRKTLDEVFLKQHLCNWPYTVLATLLALLLLIVLFFGGYFAYNYFSKLPKQEFCSVCRAALVDNRCPNTCRIHPDTHFKDGKCPKCESGKGNNDPSSVTAPGGNQQDGTPAGPSAENKEKQPGDKVKQPVPAQPSKCPVCDTPLNKNGKCPNTCRIHGIHLDVNRQCPRCRQVVSYRFKVESPKLQKSGKANVALAEFGITPLQNMKGTVYTVKNWSINRAVKAASGNRFTPEGGLSYSKVYLISAEVYVNGKQQQVEPYLWNYVDTPAWQIQQTIDDKHFKVICANSSSISYQVKNWKVEFVSTIERNRLDFGHVKIVPNGKEAAMDWNIGRFMGPYFVNITVEIEGIFKGNPTVYNKTQTFVFSHSSSTQNLQDIQPRLARLKVFRVDFRTTSGGMGNGTACAISPKILLTNYHVAVGDVYGKDRYKVCKILELSNNEQTKTYRAKVIASDLNADIAVLQLCDANGKATDDTLPESFELADDNMIMSLSNSARNERNERLVFSLGYPNGTKEREAVFCYGHTTDFGKVDIQKLRRKSPYYGHTTNFDKVATITHISGIRPGYSGGPLIDFSTGKLLGVNWGFVSKYNVKTEQAERVDMTTSMTAIRQLFGKYLDQKF